MTCELCLREVPATTRHHLVPKEEEGHRGPTANLCPACHRQTHALFDNRTLARELDTPEKLRAHPEMARFLGWVRKQRPGKRVAVRKARHRRR